MAATVLLNAILLTTVVAVNAPAASPDSENLATAAIQHVHDPEHKAAEALLATIVILIAAKLGGHFFEVRKMPAVLGELLCGILIGNVYLLGFIGFEFMKHLDAMELLAELGVIFLLFEVGLETRLADLLRVGLSSVLVAVAGVIAPFFLGYAVSAWFAPDQSALVHAFIGATLCATSVGITARVLKDMGKANTGEGRIILGAAVIDDVLGLIILAAVTGAVSTANRTGAAGGISDLIWIAGKTTVFFVVAILFGLYGSPRLFRVASKLQGKGLLLAVSLIVCFALSYLAVTMGLAPIIGAFCAGLVLEEVHYKDFQDIHGEHTIEELVRPISYFLVPIFFVLIGITVDLRAMADMNVLGFASVLTVAAILGKQACALGVVQKGVSRMAVGIGMIPRGEVGLIFASIGASLTLMEKPVIDAATYSAVVLMVIATTMLAPPLLSWAMKRASRKTACAVSP